VLAFDKIDTRNSTDQLAFVQPSMLPLNVLPRELYVTWMADQMLVDQYYFLDMSFIG